MIIRFLDWQPDAADLGTGGNIKVTNAVPAQYSYQPFPSFSVISDALTARPRGALEAFDEDGDPFQYAGDATKLYQLDNTDLTWTDVTNVGGAYTTGTDEIWNFVRWENKVLATNFSDVPQQITMGAANYSDLTTDFKARNVTVIGDFVVFSNTWDSTDGNVPNRVRWSAIGDETTYTVSSSTFSNFRDLTTGGPIRKIIGGEIGVIFSERSVFRMSFVGDPGGTAFQIDETLPDISAISAGAITSLGDSAFIIADQGFLEITGYGTSVSPIGAGRVDQWFAAEFDINHPERVFSIADPTSNRVLWAFPGTGHVSGRPNKIIVYDRNFQKWSLIEEEVEMILKSKGVDFTLDELDSLGYTNIDEMSVSLDSSQFKALSSQIGAFNSDFKLGFFRGVSKVATLETAEIEAHEGHRTPINAFSPVVDGAVVTGQVGYRNRQTDSVTWTDALTQSASGRFTKRVNAKYHRFRLNITGGTWTDAVGVQVDREDARKGARRG